MIFRKTILSNKRINIPLNLQKVQRKRKMNLRKHR